MMDWSSPFEGGEYAAFFGEWGYAVAGEVFGEERLEVLKRGIETIPDGEAVRRKRDVYGVRHLLESSPEIREVARSREVRQYVEPILGMGCFAVRAVFFDKVPQANWNLGWHQDNVITVREAKEVAGFSAWVNKAGVWQVQPPAEVLARMVAIRISLDDCGVENGPLRVLPGSHRSGWVEDQIEEWKGRVKEVVCCVPAGGIVVMCPLTLHASSKAASPSHRRVIHIEFAADELPGGVEWNQRVG
jgi:ectoine hydroxylase-related dioxygenase (phytanoyl-CoA dioxygenase family)